jgi:hypothetical protein
MRDASGAPGYGASLSDCGSNIGAGFGVRRAGMAAV